MTVSNSSPAFEIPTIDISPYLRDSASPDGLEVIQQVKTACTTTGFFSLVGHGISKELQDKVFKAAEAFFSLPLDEKKKVISPPLKNRGYELIGSQALQEGSLPDLKEVQNHAFPKTIYHRNNPAQLLPYSR
jgi:isopenicillin N synthase-like dioxygenase